MSLPYNARPKSCVFFILHFSVFRIHLLPCPSPTNQLSLDPLQSAHRLHMGAAGEEVDGLGVREGVALLREAADIARESGRIAGDIDDALRGHADHGLDDIGGKALARRIDDDDIRRLPGGGDGSAGAE